MKPLDKFAKSSVINPLAINGVRDSEFIAPEFVQQNITAGNSYDDEEDSGLEGFGNNEARPEFGMGGFNDEDVEDIS